MKKAIKIKLNEIKHNIYLAVVRISILVYDNFGGYSSFLKVLEKGFILSPGEWENWVLGLTVIDFDCAENAYQAAKKKQFKYSGKGCVNENLQIIRRKRLSVLPLLVLAVCDKRVDLSQLDVFLKEDEYVCADRRYSSLISLQRFLSFIFSYHIANSFSCTLISKKLARLAYIEIISFKHKRYKTFPNNHLLAELYYQFLMVYFLVKNNQRCANLMKLNIKLAEEFQRQIFKDGTSIEASSHYHDMATEILLIHYSHSQKFLKKLEVDREKLVKMIEFQANVVEEFFTITSFGNGIEDPVIPFQTEETHSSGCWRIFHKKYSKLSNSIKSKLFLEIKKYNGLALDPPKARFVHYKQGGFCLLQEKEVSILFRTSPSASENLLGHAHDDYGSIYLTYKNQPVFIDRGTYSYSRAVNRGAFSVSKAHNKPLVQNCCFLGHQTDSFQWSLTKVPISVVDIKIGSDEVGIQCSFYCGSALVWVREIRVTNHPQVSLYIKDTLYGSKNSRMLCQFILSPSVDLAWLNEVLNAERSTIEYLPCEISPTYLEKRKTKKLVIESTDVKSGKIINLTF